MIKSVAKKDAVASFCPICSNNQTYFLWSLLVSDLPHYQIHLMNDDIQLDHVVLGWVYKNRCTRRTLVNEFHCKSALLLFIYHNSCECVMTAQKEQRDIREAAMEGRPYEMRKVLDNSAIDFELHEVGWYRNSLIFSIFRPGTRGIDTCWMFLNMWRIWRTV